MDALIDRLNRVQHWALTKGIQLLAFSPILEVFGKGEGLNLEIQPPNQKVGCP